MEAGRKVLLTIMDKSFDRHCASLGLDPVLTYDGFMANRILMGNEIIYRRCEERQRRSNPAHYH